MHDPDVAESWAESSTDVSANSSARQWSMLHVAETGSTNDDLIEMARQGAPDRTVLRTDHQTAGRGRLDRTWTSPPGANLMVSLLFRNPPSDPGELTRRVGVAAVHGVLATTGEHPTLKWPNDLLLDGRKLAGILAQADHGTGEPARGAVPIVGTVGTVVVGIGLNTAWSPEGAADLAGAVSPADLLDALLLAFDELPDERAEFHQVYRSMLGTIGQLVRVELPNGELTGRAVDVDETGRLVVVDDCAITHRVTIGDVIHVRSESTSSPDESDLD